MTIWTPYFSNVLLMNSTSGEFTLVPATQAVKVDAVYSSLHFERMRIPDEYEGTPEEAVSRLKKDLASIDEQLKTVRQRSEKSWRADGVIF